MVMMTRPILTVGFVGADARQVYEIIVSRKLASERSDLHDYKCILRVARGKTVQLQCEIHCFGSVQKQ